MGIGKRIEEKASGNSNNSAEKVEIKSSSDTSRFNMQEAKYKLADLVIPIVTSNQINNALSFFKHSDLVMNTWGLKSTHKNSKRMCINFYGPPGTGKTMAAHAVAEKLKKKLLVINYAEIESKYVGDTPKNLVAAFKAAENEDAIIFFDEADAMLSRRVTNMKNSTDTSVNQSRSVLLNILNDYEKVVLFATNFIENYDPAFMRRILAHVKFELPDEDCRRRLFAAYTPPSMPQNMDFDLLAKKHSNISGSDISNAILLAAFSAAERESLCVEMIDIESSLKQITDSKNENNEKVKIETRHVTKEYVESNLGVKLQ